MNEDVTSITAAEALALAERVRELETMCADAYQVLGRVAHEHAGEGDWPDDVQHAMDNLAAAAQSEEIPHKPDDAGPDEALTDVHVFTPEEIKSVAATFGRVAARRPEADDA